MLNYDTNTQVIVCNRCGCVVTQSPVEGYSYYCPNYDEDLYLIEVKTADKADIISCKECEQLIDSKFAFYPAQDVSAKCKTPTKKKLLISCMR